MDRLAVVDYFKMMRKEGRLQVILAVVSGTVGALIVKASLGRQLRCTACAWCNGILTGEFAPNSAGQ